MVKWDRPKLINYEPGPERETGEEKVMVMVMVMAIVVVSLWR